MYSKINLFQWANKNSVCLRVTSLCPKNSVCLRVTSFFPIVKARTKVIQFLNLIYLKVFNFNQNSCKNIFKK